jgi:multidrug resistance efflux pump
VVGRGRCLTAVRLILRLLLVALVVLAVLIGWAWWYYRPTIEWTTRP